MSRFGRVLIVLVLLAAIGAGAGFFYYRQQLQQSYPASQNTILEIPHGAGMRTLVRMLHDRNVIQNEYIALAYLVLSGSRGKLQAGEYLFDRPMTVPEVIGKLKSGNVYLHKFVVPEGLNLGQIAGKWNEQGF